MGENVFYENTCLIESMTCYIGKTVTVYTTSDGYSKKLYNILKHK